MMKDEDFSPFKKRVRLLDDEFGEEVNLSGGRDGSFNFINSFEDDKNLEGPLIQDI